METYHKFRIEQNAIRIYVIFTGILLTMYCGLLCFDVRHFLAEWICLTGAYLVLCGGAWMFKLCWLSWAFIMYTYVVRVCIMLYGEGFWSTCPEMVEDIAHYITFGVGFVLTTIFIFNIKKYIIIIKDEKSKDGSKDA